ncbi:MAG: leucyl aminopeptidase family protein [Pseudomonadota bacterium]
MHPTRHDHQIVHQSEQSVKDPLPIFLVTRQDDLAGVPTSLRALGKQNAFKADIGSVLAGEEGVLVGAGDGTDAFALAAASEKLPEGDYSISGPSITGHGAGDITHCLAWCKGAYQFTRYKEQGRRKARLVVPDGTDLDRVRKEADAVFLARDLVNTPAGDMLPHELEAVIREVGDDVGADVNSIVGDDLLTENFPMIHAVGRASAVAPRLIDLRWGEASAPKLTIVGKGVCFDSGGLNIKPGSAMSLMKKDMGGAANAIALARLIIDRGLNVNLRLLVPAVENSISGAAFRPGDILASRKGLNVEIGNTDAEGRLVLADAMAYGAEAEPDMMITLATLTGAARVALGPELPPFYCDDEGFADLLSSCGKDQHDPLWRMPLWKSYESMLSTPVADMNNAPSGPFAGSILAALFLKRFAPASAIWAHFDIFAWRANAAPGRPVGGEAQAIRALMASFDARFG